MTEVMTVTKYLGIIIKEKSTIRKAGVKSKKTWTYTLGRLGGINVEEDGEYEEDSFRE